MVNTLGYQLATFKLTGEAIWMGLEFGLGDIESNDEFFLQVSLGGLSNFHDMKNKAREAAELPLLHEDPSEVCKHMRANRHSMQNTISRSQTRSNLKSGSYDNHLLI